MSDPLIDVDSVSVALGETRILRDVSLSVPSGSFVALVGPNGAGKTTLLRTINGVLTPDRGSVSIDGRDIQSLSSRAIARSVATVAQDTTVSFSFSVRDVVAMGRTPHRSRFRRMEREPIERALERTRTAELADRSIETVSGGERQRVLLARALAQETPALVLDEPTASLDVTHQVRTLGLVRTLVDEGKTALAAIHDLDLAARFCDAIVVLADGQVLARGSPETVFTESVIEQAFGGETRVHIHENPATDSPSITMLRSGDP
ncbi:heme ABC transporter ATP-binding protein [Halocatena salina]|uniref:Cobalamin import ATP-binding protein BtuD n=1 Tax=Halocatena salina TaxID=2934340 RepID=A0A8U0A5Z4_9EURY|nr:heme ABC transporter ATP-binding protein [Halocatena salina]UPM43373.1 heme ABC transporter ATP-binding protein [Halocatena salina]